MKTIWKFELETTDRQTISMPKDALILNINTQGDIPVLYALVNTDNKVEYRIIEIFGTGHEIPNGIIYLGTYSIQSMVWHVFDH